MSNFKIDEGVPIPKHGAGRSFKYPWNTLKVGDSVLINSDNVVSARTAALSYARRHKLVFVTRQTSNGVRIWRTA